MRTKSNVFCPRVKHDTPVTLPLTLPLTLRRVVGSDGSGGNLSQFGFDVGAGTSRFGSGSGAATVLVGFDERVATAKRVGIVVVGRNGRLIMQDETTALAGRAFLGERLDQTLADALAVICTKPSE